MILKSIMLFNNYKSYLNQHKQFCLDIQIFCENMKSVLKVYRALVVYTKTQTDHNDEFEPSAALNWEFYSCGVFLVICCLWLFPSLKVSALIYHQPKAGQCLLYCIIPILLCLRASVTKKNSHDVTVRLRHGDTRFHSLLLNEVLKSWSWNHQLKVLKKHAVFP